MEIEGDVGRASAIGYGDLPKREVVLISAGASHSVALLSGNLVCSWGRGEDGQLGHGNAEDLYLPALLNALDGKEIVSVVCGADHTAAYSEKKLQVYSWGWGDFGRLGHGNSSDVFTPQPIKALEGIKIKQLACGDSHCLAVTVFGEVQSWGRNQNGQLGLGNTEDSLLPQKITTFEGIPIKMVAAGAEHTAAISENVTCLKVGLVMPITALTRKVVQISSGWRHTVALTERKNVFSWGRGTTGQLGHGDSIDRNTPKLIEALSADGSSCRNLKSSRVESASGKAWVSPSERYAIVPGETSTSGALGIAKITQAQWVLKLKINVDCNLKKVEMGYDMDASVELGYKQELSKCFDDDGRPRRRGTMWTASAHIITAVIGSGVLSLAWAIAQLGWIAGPAVMILFAFVIYYTSALLADCYRSGDPITGKRNYTYMDAVHANLGGLKVKMCGYIQYLNLFGVAIGYTIAASISMTAIERSNCFHKRGDDSPCHTSSNPYMILFGIIEIVFSQIPDFDQIWWLSILAAIMSFTYSSIGLGLGILEVVRHRRIQGSLTGISIGASVSPTHKLWQSLQAFGDIAFAYSYSLILIEIQDTIRSPPPSEAKVMKRATLVSVAVTTVFYTLCGSMGYAAFGDAAPGNLLTGFGFYNPYWLLDVANAAIVIHLVGAYQVGWGEVAGVKDVEERDQGANLAGRELQVESFPDGVANSVRVGDDGALMLLPFFNDIVGLMGALGFWPLTVYFPVEMYIVQKKIARWSTRWVCLQLLSVACLIVSVAAAVGSVAGIVDDLKLFKPFKNSY
ncbi:hypothetical protein HPP92_006622 [Vanilla planifolia]|uniref:Amino acid transporter transmembrane domain-containing protein n=1 Tax=Vanilla planifolia TaxID=51239 RepID=A0A835V6Y4_VANPL|nr:hypothetical protein HPP92_006622 [Vanilla planifolia]